MRRKEEVREQAAKARDGRKAARAGGKRLVVRAEETKKERKCRRKQ